MKQIIIPIKPDELHMGNYIQCVNSSQSRFVRVLAIRPIRHSEGPDSGTHLLDTIDPFTKKKGYSWHIESVAPISITRSLLLDMGFREQPAGVLPTDDIWAYEWPIDRDSYWLVSIQDQVARLWLVHDGEEWCVAQLNSLHHLQNLFLDLEQVRLRFENDPYTAE